MKKHIITLFSLIMIYGSTAHADEATDYNDDPISFGELDGFNPPPYFGNFEADYNWMGRAKFSTPEEKGHHLKFAEGEYNLRFIRLYNGREGFSLGAGYQTNHIDWDNEFFNEDNFEKVLIGFHLFTYRIPCWEWKAGITARLDVDHIDFYDHTIWDFLAWGRYSWKTCYWEEVGLNIGFIGKTGIDKDWVIPIFGLDFSAWDCWEVSLVFPTDISIGYKFNDCWSFVATNRFWNTRYRVSGNEPLSEGIWDYKNAGADIGIKYALGLFLEADIHAGYTYGKGDIKIQDKDGHTVRHNKFDAAPYFGGSFDMKF